MTSMTRTRFHQRNPARGCRTSGKVTVTAASAEGLHQRARGMPRCAWMLLSALTVFVCASAWAASSSPPVLLDRIVAVVNKDVITLGQLNDRVDVVTRQLKQQKVSLPPIETIQRQVLERMIAERAQLQLAEDNGIRVDDQQVDRAIERIAAENQMSLADFRQALERDKLPFERLRTDIRTEILLARVRDREVDSRILVVDSEVDDFIAGEGKREAANMKGAEYLVSQILLRIPDGASSEQIEALRAKAQGVAAQARAKTAFSELAVSQSEGSDALQGGSMGWRARNRIPELFLAALDTMKPGDTSGVLRSPAGFHVLHLDDLRGVSKSEEQVEQIHAEHILIRTNELVSDGEAHRRINQLRERIVEGANFEELARLNSDDGSASRGGDLGWIFPGDTVAEFDRMLRQLSPGELSEPVRTQFGWHLIRVIEKRRGDVSIDRKRAQARKAVRDSKSDEAYENWLRELRDRTYVEYRLEER